MLLAVELYSIDLMFLKTLMSVENSVKDGWKDGKWYPHESAEGGTPTIAYGYKLTMKDVETERFKRGITETEAIDLMLANLKHKHTQLKFSWNETQNNEFEFLPKKYRYVLLDLIYNVGLNKVYKDEQWLWPKLAQAIIDNNDQKVYEESIRSYRKPSGERAKLTVRSTRMCSALGLNFRPV